MALTLRAGPQVPAPRRGRQGIQHRLDHRRAFGGQVTADDAGAVQAGVQGHPPVQAVSAVAAAGPALDQAEQARQVCQRCPAQEPCLRWALDRGVAFGIWGGTTEDERRAMRDAARAGGTTIPRVKPGGAGSR